MKKLIAAALAAAVIVPMAAPVAAQAQHRGDRHDYRGDRHDYRGDRHDRGDRGWSDRRFDERDHNWRDNDWRDHRNSNRGYYSRGNWRAPFRYQHFRPGVRIGFDYFGPRYVINDPWRYHLPRAGYGRVWVRHYDDLLLVDTRRGVVIRVIDNFYW
ncbi:RcnB family protein [Sphingomonas sp. LB-2]|uniref:RcnB family protein n=1 Tax=Sphingomonas caeni TaxID=2984949 RepID=UPI00222F8090|nr:RcnB family protein [Sphingomonas caeni]MCW3846538.1 RcnB family protein [Sphingomonas caeni]